MLAGGYEQLDPYELQDPQLGRLYNLCLKRRGSLSIWFDPEMVWEAALSGRRGRQQAYSDAAIQACLILKVLFGLPPAADDGLCDQPAQACRVGLVYSRLQHPMPPRKNAKMWKLDTPGARARSEAVRSSKYLGRALWRRWSVYHRRSRVETKMQCVKLLGQRLSARDFDRQGAELQIRAAILNGFTALGIPRTVAMG